MKIICIGRNYIDHAKELNNPIPEKPVLFLKPDTALLKKGAPFFLPEHSNNVHHEAELVIRINRLGKHIEERFAHKYYEEIGLGIDFTARDVQKSCKEKGLPWEIAKAFDGSAPLGKFIAIKDLGKVDNINFELKKNGSTVQFGNSSEMIFNFNQIISYVSKIFTLKIGDLIYTGTPAGVGPVVKGDKIQGFINGIEVLKCKVL
ncbi:MAG: 2-hydroxyhepta-2,4-diene-1,7-dioate isomerase [Crocinitomicaceae bacterium]|nr:2-hydroxyhepta-2,4-diene-1,7-dioate isomerase [Crocinitomicaceae bacterium]|tara:strand:+ start:26337 stop:26948 length:612 start_codon:yes stop_codon:yes gene_type:complete